MGGLIMRDMRLDAANKIRQMCLNRTFNGNIVGVRFCFGQGLVIKFRVMTLNLVLKRNIWQTLLQLQIGQEKACFLSPRTHAKALKSPPNKSEPSEFVTFCVGSPSLA